MLDMEKTQGGRKNRADLYGLDDSPRHNRLDYGGFFVEIGVMWNWHVKIRDMDPTYRIRP